MENDVIFPRKQYIIYRNADRRAMADLFLHKIIREDIPIFWQTACISACVLELCQCGSIISPWHSMVVSTNGREAKRCVTRYRFEIGRSTTRSWHSPSAPTCLGRSGLPLALSTSGQVPSLLLQFFQTALLEPQRGLSSDRKPSSAYQNELNSDNSIRVIDTDCTSDFLHAFQTKYQYKELGYIKANETGWTRWSRMESHNYRCQKATTFKRSSSWFPQHMVTMESKLKTGAKQFDYRSNRYFILIWSSGGLGKNSYKDS